MSDSLLPERPIGPPQDAAGARSFELRVLPAAAQAGYQCHDGHWRREPLPSCPALRLAVDGASMSSVSLLARPSPAAPTSVLQVLCESARRDALDEPRVQWIDEAGIRTWRGPDAREVHIHVHALRDSEPPRHLGVALIEQCTPAVHVLRLRTERPEDGALRTEPLKVLVYAWPDEQWLVAWQREAGAASRWPVASGAAMAAGTRVRIECDGGERDGAAWRQAFDVRLPAALASRLTALFGTFSRQVERPVMEATITPLMGDCSMSWGWQHNRSGLQAPPDMHVLAHFDLACHVDLTLEGDLRVGAAVSRVRLAARGSSYLVHHIDCHGDAAAVSEAMAAVVLTVRVPIQIESDPMALESAASWSPGATTTGMLILDAGLRPRLSGSGWQWFAKVSIDAIEVSAALHDPVLGDSVRTVALLPASDLLDWCAG